MDDKNKNPEVAPVVEPDIEETAETVEASEPEKNELELLTGKYNELNDKYLRLMAEYDNFRKRTLKERDDIYPSAMATAVGKFLPVLDNFERAAAFPHSDDDFGKGFDMIYQSMREILESIGVEAVGKEGESFNPELHNAVMHIEDENLGENVVAKVLQKGYKIGGRVIRCAMVQTAN